MKNKLIYILISLMTISVIGIVILQFIWISNALEQKEFAFSRKVTRVLNDLNSEIDKHETFVFINKELGGLDSLNIPEHTIEKTNFCDSAYMYSKNNYPSVQIQLGTQKRSCEGKEVNNPFHHIKNKHCDTSDTGDNMNISVHVTDSTLTDFSKTMKGLEKKVDQVEAIIQRFTFEQMLSNHLEDRISMEKVEAILQKSIKKEDILSNYEFAIYNDSKRNYEKYFTSSNFDSTTQHHLYKKKLFPNDHLKRNTYQLAMYFTENSSEIWSGIWSMVILSVLFSALIIACFGYSVYYIFKQKKISQVKNDFINNMTHELKTPLASISLAAASIKHPKIIVAPSEIEHFVEIIHSEENRMRHHFERLLEMATIAKGELKLRMENINLYTIIKKSLKNVDLSLHEYGGLVHFDPETENACINGDSFHLINAVTNVLDNSIKYRRESLKIAIKLTESPSEYLISIKDNGIGMTKRSVQLAFDEFYREETGNIHSQRGFGIGLSYVKSIIEAHNGSVRIESTANQGTTVQIYIPKK